MEMEFFFFLPLLLCVTLFTFFSIHKFTKKPTIENLPNDQNIPLPPGRTGWPLIGETLDYFFHAKKGALGKFVMDRRNKYSSKVFRTSLIGQEVAILCGPEGNKFLFSNEKKLVQNWYPSSVEKIFPKSHSKPSHDDFMSVRKLLTSFLKADALRRYVTVMDLVMKQHLHSTDWDQEQVKVYPTVAKYTFTLACRIFLSIDDQKKVEELVVPIEDIQAGMLSMPFNFPGTALNRAIKASKMIRSEIEAMVKQRKIDLLEKKASPTQDILSLMLVETEMDGRFFNDCDISSHLLGLLQGGYSTINDTLTYVMKYLAEHPDVYHEVLREQTEITNSKEPKELLDWEDLKQMRYSWNVVNEVLRLMAPGSGSFREAIIDFTYAGYRIPKGWKLHWISHATHKNPEYFPNPEKFDPSRFEGKEPTPYAFVPFGGGPRMCPGSEYARLAILVFMHNMVTKFKWEKLTLNEKFSIRSPSRPIRRLVIRLHPHNP